jgi:hypothetical protein
MGEFNDDVSIAEAELLFPEAVSNLRARLIYCAHLMAYRKQAGVNSVVKSLIDFGMNDVGENHDTYLNKIKQGNLAVLFEMAPASFIISDNGELEIELFCDESILRWNGTEWIDISP